MFIQTEPMGTLYVRHNFAAPYRLRPSAEQMNAKMPPTPGLLQTGTKRKCLDKTRQQKGGFMGNTGEQEEQN